MAVGLEVGAAAEAPFGSLAGGQRERALLAAATDEERDGPADGLGGGLLPRLADDRDRRLEPIETLLQGQEGDVELGVLDLVPAGADAEHQPAAGEDVDRGRHLRQQRRVPERHRGDVGTEGDALGPFRAEGERDPGLDAVAPRLAHQADEVVAAPEGLEAEVFDKVAEVPPAVPVEPLLPFDHHAQNRHLRLA